MHVASQNYDVINLVYNVIGVIGIINKHYT